MKFYVVLLLSIASYLHLGSAKCPMGTIQGITETDCYLYKSTPALWFSAEENCIQYGGHLASISSDLANEFVPQVVDASCDTELWVGGGWNTETTRKWAWTDGTAFKYTNWASGEPSGAPSSVRCISLRKGDDHWYSSSCSVAKPYMCKVPSIGNSTGGGTQPHQVTTSICPSCPPAQECPTASPCPPPTVCASSCANPSQPQCNQCSDGWTYNPFSQKCYKLIDSVGSQNWTEALSICQQLGADLPSIHSNKDNAWLSVFAIDSKMIGVGLYRSNRNAHWQWTDGSDAKYINWAPTAPDFCSGDYNRGTMVTDFAMSEPFSSWSNCYAFWTFPVICQKQPLS